MPISGYASVCYSGAPEIVDAPGGVTYISHTQANVIVPAGYNI